MKEQRENWPQIEKFMKLYIAAIFHLKSFTIYLSKPT